MNRHSATGIEARQAGRDALAAALREARRDTLALFARYQAAGRLEVPASAELNPPLWELGHIGWFQQWWLARNPERERGAAADPAVPRIASVRADADALYNSSRVPHDTRWSLPLPSADATRADLAAQLQATLALLSQAGDGDDALYFFRLALLHEDMHHEAALYTAQSLGIAVDDARWQPRPNNTQRAGLKFDAAPWTLGNEAGGFAFDNELGVHEVPLPAFEIDSRAVTWGEYLPFIDAVGRPAPRYLRRTGTGWQRCHHGRWQALDRRLPACHINAPDAEAWCAWTGRRLPTEAEWERAAIERPEAFSWGDVWEWTASVFAPLPGFVPHPYRDYSAPWFDGQHRVLRGAAFGTQPRMHHPRYRNFFIPSRDEIFAGFRSCAI